MSLYRKLRKLRRDPIAFCLDAKLELLRRYGQHLFLKQTARYERLGAAHADRKITVVMTAFNTSHLVEKAVRSVLAQTHKNLELMIIDDASTDDTLDVLKALAREDERVRVFHSPDNHGTYWSKNWCLAHADSEFVAFHDSDDVSEPKRLQTQLGAMVANQNAAAATARWRRVDDDGNALTIDGLSERMAAISLMIRREKVLKNTGFFDCVRISADTEFITRITQVFGKKNMVHMRQVLYIGLLRDGSLTTAVGSGFSWNPDAAGRSFKRELSGDRAEYHRLFHEWHDGNLDNPDVLQVAFPQAERPFHAPEGMCKNCNDMDISKVVECSGNDNPLPEAKQKAG
ncbi:glycosyltransferase family 2 protein [Kordiimonas aquimaris]|uniref:glycosyltransferase family 2 protein n=1 Tax=Kordiimonas aquimaris TaxID=707591 RepID=UPI0021D16A9F|nr:glycosyltransferase family A protein [Kordiimonas aquimaris]